MSEWQPIASAPLNADWILVYLPDATPTTYRVKRSVTEGVFGKCEWQVDAFTYLTPWSKPTLWMPEATP